MAALNLTTEKNVYYVVYIQRYDAAHDQYLQLESFKMPDDRLTVIKHVKKLIAQSLTTDNEIVDASIYAQIDLDNGGNLAQLVFEMKEY